MVRLYDELRDGYRDFIPSPTGTLICSLFDNRFPGSGLTDLKKIDLVLWQLRSLHEPASP